MYSMYHLEYRVTTLGHSPVSTFTTCCRPGTLKSKRNCCLGVCLSLWCQTTQRKANDKQANDSPHWPNKRFNPTCAASGVGVVVYSLVRHTRVNLGVRRKDVTSINQPRSIAVVIRPDIALINGMPLGRSGPPSDFHSIFGVPDRVIDACPTLAPVGYRHNQIHYYDSLGITLNEHHFTNQIQAITFVFDIHLAVHPTKMPFTGSFDIAGFRVGPNALERQLSESRLEFSATLPGTWFAEINLSAANGSALSIAVCTKGAVLPSGHRSKARRITDISLSLDHDPWDTTHTPQL